jgi:hypothetical protein
MLFGTPWRILDPFWFRVARNGGPKLLKSMAKSMLKPMPEKIEKWYRNDRKIARGVAMVTFFEIMQWAKYCCYQAIVNKL